MLRLAPIIAALLLPLGASAQTSMPSWDPAMEGMTGVMNHGVREAARRGQLGRPTASGKAQSKSNARQICANKRAYQARMDAERAQRLEALCAQAGYR